MRVRVRVRERVRVRVRVRVRGRGTGGADAARDAVVPLEPAQRGQHVVLCGAPQLHVS